MIISQPEAFQALSESHVSLHLLAHFPIRQSLMVIFCRFTNLVAARTHRTYDGLFRAIQLAEVRRNLAIKWIGECCTTPLQQAAAAGPSHNGFALVQGYGRSPRQGSR